MKWQNWARNQSCTPSAVVHPTSEDELAQVVKQAAAAGQMVKVVGSGHSFTDAACTTGVQVALDKYNRVLEVDRETGQVTVEAGISIARLNKSLAAVGRAMPNLGDIAYQTISGAIATATHGTGARLGGIATQVVGMTIVAGDGSLIHCSAVDEPEVLHAGRVGVGALGAVSTVTLQTVPAFRLRAVEQPMRVDQVLEELDHHVDSNEHFEFFYVPHTGWALTKRNNRTDEPVGGMSRWMYFKDKILFENVLFGVACRLGKLRPAWIPRLARMVPSSGRTEYVKASHEIFASTRWVKFLEMEYAVPRAEVAGVLTRIRNFIDSSGLRIGFPIEVRFTAPDDIPLSTAHGRDSGYLAIHVYRGMPYEQYFRAFEAICDEVGGRPHWGKLHFQTAETLAPRYPEWDRFQAVRRRLDPEGRFRNTYTDRVLGSVGRR